MRTTSLCLFLAISVFFLFSGLSAQEIKAFAEPDAFTNFTEQGQHPAILNHNPRYTVDTDIKEVDTVALTLVVREYLGEAGGFSE